MHICNMVINTNDARVMPMDFALKKKSKTF